MCREGAARPVALRVRRKVVVDAADDAVLHVLFDLLVVLGVRHCAVVAMLVGVIRADGLRHLVRGEVWSFMEGGDGAERARVLGLRGGDFLSIITPLAAAVDDHQANATDDDEATSHSNADNSAGGHSPGLGSSISR